MKRYINFIMVFLNVIYKAGATIPGNSVLSKSDKGNITVYAKRLGSLYLDFKINFMEQVYSRPFG